MSQSTSSGDPTDPDLVVPDLRHERNPDALAAPNGGKPSRSDEPDIDESLFERVAQRIESGLPPAEAPDPGAAVEDPFAIDVSLGEPEAAPVAGPADEPPVATEAAEPPPDPEERRALARQLEATLASFDGRPDGAADALRSRLVKLYREELDDAEMAFHHLEPLLTRDQIAEEMLEAGEVLLMRRALAGRVAPVLAGAYARLGRHVEESGPLALELMLSEPPRLDYVRRRLGTLRQEVLDDPEGALELFELVLETEPGDDEMRQRFIELSRAQGRAREAATFLSGALSRAGDMAVKARLALDVGRLLFLLGDQEQARVALELALSADTRDGAVLLAARELCAFPGGAGNVLVQALSMLAAREPIKEARHQAARALLELGERQKLAGATEILAWKALLDSDRELEALARLEALCEAAGDDAILADVLARRAELASDAEAAAAFALRSTEALARAAATPDAQIDVWHAYFARYATTPEARAKLFSSAGLSDTALRALRRSVLREAEMSADPHARIALLSEAASYLDEQPDTDEQAIEIAMLGLLHAALQMPELLPEWLARVVRHSARMPPRPRADLFARAIAVAGDSPERLPLLMAAARAFSEADDEARALDAYARALAQDPGSPEILAALDGLAARGGQALSSRIERYRAALGTTGDPSRKADLACAIGRLEREADDDIDLAIDRARAVVMAYPGHAGAHAALLELLAERGNREALAAELGRARGAIADAERISAALGVTRSLCDRGADGAAVELGRLLLGEPWLDSAALDAIASLGDRQEDVELLRSVFETRVRLAAQGPERVAAYERLGEFLSERMGDGAAAAAAWKAAAKEAEASGDRGAESRRLYERALESAGDDPEAADALIRSYADAKDWTQITGVFNVLLRQADAPEKLARPIDLLLALAEQAAAGRAGVEYAALVDEVLWRLGAEDKAKIRALLASKARVFAADPARAEAAAESFRALIESQAEPEDVEEFRGFVERQADPEFRREELSWLFEWRAAKAEAPSPILLEWARVEEERFGDPGSAAAICERALAQDPENLEALEYLAELRLRSADWDGREECLERLSTRVDETRRLPIELERASILVEKLDRAPDALPLLERVLSAQPENSRARELLRGLLRAADPELRARAATLLVRACADDAPALLARVLDQALAATSELGPLGDEDESARFAEERQAWYERAIALSKDPRAAFALAERAALENPASEPLWAAMSAQAVALGDPALAIGVYRRALERAAVREEIDELGQRLVAFADTHSVDVEVTTSGLLALLAAAPDARWALDRVKLFLHAKGRYDELFELYDRAVDATDDEAERADLLNEASVAAKDLAADVDRAIGYLERLLDLRGNDSRVDVLLERLYERHGRVAQLIEHLERRLPRLTGDELAELRERIVGLRLDAGDAEQALPMIEAMLAEDPESEPAIALLERLFAAAPARRAVDGEPCSAERAGALLRERYAELRRPAEVARLLREELSFVTVRERRMALLEQLADLSGGELGDRQTALSAVGELVLLAPDDGGRRERLATLAEELGAHAQRVDYLLRAAEHAGPGELAADLILEAARVAENALEKPERAAQLYEQLLETAGERRELVLEALGALSRLWLALERFDKRCDVLERLASVEEAAERKCALTEAARTAARELADPARAARSWRTLVDENPDDLEALDGLVAALQASGSHAELAEALKLRIERGRDAAAVRRDEKALARILAERLGDRPAAIAIWQDLYDRERGDAEALDALAALLEAEGRHAELIRLFETAIGEAREPRPLYLRLAAVHTQHTKDTRAALVALLAAGDLALATELAESEPKLDDPPLRLELGGALLAAGKADDAVRVLRSQIEQYGDRRPKERALVHSLRARAELAAERPAVALSEMKEAAAIDPGNPRILYDLGELALEQADLDVADQSFRALLLVALHPGDGQGEPPRRAEIYYRLSEIAERRWDSDSAQELLSSALDTALESEEESAGLERAVCRSGKDELVLQVLELTQKQAQGPAAACAALLRLIEARAERGPLSDALAERVRQRAEELRAELAKAKHKKLGVEAWRPLLEVQRRLGGADGMLELLGYLGKRFAKSEVGSELLLEAGRLMLDIPERRAEGVEILEQALEREPGRDDVALLLAQAFEADGKLEPALARYESVAGRQSELQKPALQALARLFETSQAPAERRIRVLEQLLGLEQGEEASRAAERLFELRRDLGDSDGALSALEAGLAADPGRASLAIRFADLCAEAGESERALAVLDQALLKTPGDLELERRSAAALAACGRHAEALESLERIHDKGGIGAAELLAAIEQSGVRESKRWRLREIALLTESGERERARQRLSEWLSRNAEDAEALRELARLYGAERAWPEAIEAYERLLRLETGSAAVKAVHELADACERAGQIERALPELERIDRAVPGQASIRKLLGRVYADTKQHEKLARLLVEDAEAAGASAARAELLESAGRHWLEAGMPEQAALVLEQARALSPERASIAVSYARALARLGRVERAASCMWDAIKSFKSPRDPQRLRLLEDLAHIHLEADELLEAYDVLTQAHRADRANLRIALTLGLLAFDLDEFSVAGSALRIVIVAARGEGGLSAAERSSAYYYLGWMQYLKGSDASARQMAHKAVEEDPSNLEAQKLLDLVDAHLRG